MGKQNTTLQVPTYTSDFGTTFTNLPVRFSDEAPIPTGIYTARAGACSGGGLPLKPRYLKASFATGTYKYVVPAVTNIATMVAALITEGAICIDLIGEKWANLPTSVMSDPAPTFRTTPFAAADITGLGDKETGKFDYVSEVLGTQRLGYAVESQNADLLAAGKAGLTNAVTGGLNSRPRNGVITPRTLKIHALVDDDTTVNRKVAVSAIGNLATVIDSIAAQAYYLSYAGESVKRLQDN